MLCASAVRTCMELSFVNALRFSKGRQQRNRGRSETFAGRLMAYCREQCPGFWDIAEYCQLCLVCVHSSCFAMHCAPLQQLRTQSWLSASDITACHGRVWVLGDNYSHRPSTSYGILQSTSRIWRFPIFAHNYRDTMLRGSLTSGVSSHASSYSHSYCFPSFLYPIASQASQRLSCLACGESHNFQFKYSIQLFITVIICW